MADNPSWFNEAFYLKSKLKQLQVTEPDANWTLESLTQALADAGLTPLSHFEAYGLTERTSPNPNFNAVEYLEAKLRQLQESQPGVYTSIEQVAEAIKNAGLDLWQHFQEYGWKEGVNPSNDFDINGYFEKKLAELQESDPEGDWDMEKMKDAFENAGLDPVSHYEGYGKNEPGVEPVQVPEENRVPPDPNPVDPEPDPEPEPEPEPGPAPAPPPGPVFTVDKSDAGVVTFGGSSTGSVTVKQAGNTVTFTAGLISRSITLDDDQQLSDLSFSRPADIARIVAADGGVVLKSLPYEDNDTPRKITLFDDIQNAIDAADHGDEINVGKGNWTESLSIGAKVIEGVKVPVNGLTLVGAGSTNTVIHSNGAQGILISGHGLPINDAIKGLTIRNLGVNLNEEEHVGIIAMSNVDGDTNYETQDLTIENVLITNGKHVGLGLYDVNGVTLNNVQFQGINPGAGSDAVKDKGILEAMGVTGLVINGGRVLKGEGDTSVNSPAILMMDVAGYADNGVITINGFDFSGTTTPFADTTLGFLSGTVAFTPGTISGARAGADGVLKFTSIADDADPDMLTLHGAQAGVLIQDRIQDLDRGNLDSTETVIDGSAAGYGLNATGASFAGHLTVDGFTVIAGSQGGIGQFMSASDGSFIVQNNIVLASENSFSKHGNAIQITGEGSEVNNNYIEITPYTGEGSSDWAVSSITVVKNANDSVIEGNIIRLAEGGVLGPNHEVMGIAVDGKYSDLVGIHIANNSVSSLTSGITIMDGVTADITGNMLEDNGYGIALGSKSAGWIDSFDITIGGNTFTNNAKADIVFFDFEDSSVVIEENAYSGTIPAIWFDEAGTYGSVGNAAELEIDIGAFVLGETTLQDGVFVSSADGFGDGKLIARRLDLGESTSDWVVTAPVAGDETAFKHLEITLAGSSGFSDDEVLDLFASSPFWVVEDEGKISFEGIATGDITMDVENGKIVFTRSNIKVVTDFALSDDAPALEIELSEGDHLKVEGSVLHGQSVRFTGEGTVNITDVTINQSEVTEDGAQFASVSADLSKTLLLNILDRIGPVPADPRPDATLIHINGTEVDFIKASWVYFDQQYYSGETNWSNYYNTELNEAKANLALLYTDYLDNGGDATPFLEFIAKTAVNGSGEQTREQVLHDNILGELTKAALTDRKLLDEYEAAAGEYIDRPWIDGVYANAYNDSQNQALRFDYEKGWVRAEYLRDFVGNIDDSAIKDGVETYYGDGNTVTNFSITRHEGAGIELALKAKQRKGPDYIPDDESGDIPIYTAPTGAAEDSPNWGKPAIWSFDFSVATSLNGATKKLDNFDFILSLDVDPSENVDFIQFKLLKPDESKTYELPDGLGRVWAKLSPEGDYTGDGFDYAQEVYPAINELISQNSVNIGFDFIQSELSDDYDFGPGNFDILLEAYELDTYQLETGVALVTSQIRVHVGDVI